MLRERCKLTLFHFNSLLIQIYLLDCLLFTPLNCLCILVKNKLSMHVIVHFWTPNLLLFHSLAVYPYARSALLCSRYFNWTVWAHQLVFVFCFQNYLGYFEPLQYHKEFKSSLSVSAEIGIFYSIALNLQADLGYFWGNIYVSQITRVWYLSI